MSTHRTIRITTTADDQSTESFVLAISLQGAVRRTLTDVVREALEEQPRRRLIVTFEVVEGS